MDMYYQNLLVSSKKFEDEKNYWLTKLSGSIRIDGFPSEFGYPYGEMTENTLTMDFTLPSGICERIMKLSNRSESGTFIILLAAVKYLLYRYNHNEDIIVGMPQFKQMKGKNSLLALRTIVCKGKEDSFKDILIRVKETVFEARKYRNISIDMLTEHLNLNTDIEGRPLLSKVIVAMQNIHESPSVVADTLFSFSLSNLGINLKISYNSCLCSKETIQRLAGHMINFLDIVTKKPEIRLVDIDILSQKEKNQILNDFNSTETIYPKEKTVHQLFMEQVLRTPDHTAVVCGDKSLTYGEFDIKSNQLARVLRERGVKPGQFVGVMVRRSIEMFVAIMGILKAGGAYLPLDPQYPTDRIKYMLDDSRTGILLTDGRKENGIGYKGEVIDVTDESLYKGDCTAPDNLNVPEDLVYIIYTSGSTGKPKGVLLEHRNVNNFIKGITERIRFGTDKTILCLTSISFDIFVLESLLPLSQGAKVVIADEMQQADARLLKELLVTSGANMLQATPSRMKLILSDPEALSSLVNLKEIMIGGEPFPVKLLNELRRWGTYRIYNMYGPTETTVWSTMRELTESEKVDIGKPIANTQIYILDKNNRPAPIGVIGELCIGGDGLARGYLNRPELTAEKFIQNPVKDGKHDGNRRIYRTGDLAKWLPDGNIECLGRVDHQVKIRGYRVELGEIEKQLLQYPGVKEAVVIDRTGHDGEKYLCAYIVSQSQWTVAELREHLMGTLPEYMVPPLFVHMDKVPLTPNGKVDRKSLPTPSNLNLAIEKYIAPSNNEEKTLSDIWGNVLGLEKVGVMDNFFTLGGDSLKAMQMTYRIHKEFNVEVPLREIFIQSDIKKLAHYIMQAEKSEYLSIEPVEEREYYPLSSAQKRLFILCQFEGANISYNMPSIMIIDGELDRVRFETAVNKLVERHESFRISFEMTEEGPILKVHNDFKVDMDYMNAEGGSLEKLVDNFIRPFDLSKAPLLRICLVKLEDKKYLMLLDMHHIISDGTSTNIFFRDFACLYQGLDLPELKVQYKEYIFWQDKLLKSKLMEKQERFWMNRFSDNIPVLDLPTDFQRPTVQSFEGDRIWFSLDKDIVAGINKLCSQYDVTLFMVLLAAYNILLYKLTGQEDIVVGSPIAGRTHSDLENIIGMFINMLPLRNKPSGFKTFVQFINEVKENALIDYENQDYQFEEFIEKLNIPRDISRGSLFDTMFVIQNTPHKEEEIKGLKFSPFQFENKIAKYDLSLNVIEKEEILELELEYCSKIFRHDTAERLTAFYTRIVKGIIQNPEIRLVDIDILSHKEKNQILNDFNSTETIYPKEKTVHQLFMEQVLRTPDHTAVVCGDKSLTYGEFDIKSNQLARVLRERGVKPGQFVGVMVRRSIEMFVAIMGILKAGGAYLPLDPQYPTDRIKYMLDDSRTGILLTDGRKENGIGYKGEVIDVTDESLYKGDCTAPDNLNVPEDLVYIIYTSGSTGKPKGVLLEHRNVNNFIKGITERIRFGTDKTILCLTSISFDIFVLESLLPLSQGAKVVIADEMQQADARLLKELLVTSGANMLQATPSRMKLILSDPEALSSLVNLKEIMIGGEPFPVKLLNELRRWGTYRIYNMYGPTETTVWSTMRELTESEKVDIGKPIANTQIYILDKNNRPAPIGVIGELCIGGDGLARGYLNRPELTAEKFIQNPVKDGKHDGNRRIYRTGDLAKWLPDGNIECLGRVDHQVKIRGYRIELGEIEKQLLQYPGVKEAVVIDRTGHDGEKYLCAYIVSQSQWTVAELREHLLKDLPQYMIPSYFLSMQRIPVTSNSKLDRMALPEPSDDIVIQKDYVAPSNDIEAKLVDILKDILAVNKLGVNDNFFELGGDSLKAMMLIYRIQKGFNVEILLKEVFILPTVRGIAKRIKEMEESMYLSITPAEDREYYPLSSAQKRLYILSEADRDNVGYNMPGVMTVDGDIDVQRFEDAFKKLIVRHESLRTSFEIVNEEPVQRIHNNFEFGILYEEETFEEPEEIIKSFIKPFDLSMAPLIRVKLVKLHKDKYLLLYDMHHIISDGISMSILIKEFVYIYKGLNLNELVIQYKDFTVWQYGALESNKFKEQELYWLDRFEGEIPLLNMPVDFPRPPVQSYEGARVGFSLPADATASLKNLAVNTGTTIYMILLAAYNVLLSKYTGQEDIIVGSPIAGRRHADLEDVIGVFINSIAIRNFPEGRKRFSEFLEEVKTSALMAFDNQDYQFEELVERLNIPRDPGRNPLFDTMFVLQNIRTEDMEIEGLKISPYSFESGITKFDITLEAFEEKATLELNLNYRTRLFKKETAEMFLQRFINILSEVSKNPELPISEINILSDKEKQTLQAFNNNYVPYLSEKMIYELFEEQASRVPDNKALEFENQSLSYSELNGKANSFALELRKWGVKRGMVVPILMEGCIEVVISMLSIMKTGAAFCPLDIRWPLERLKTVLSELGEGILIVDKRIKLREEAIGKEIMIIDYNELNSIEENLLNDAVLDDPIYIIYTSGSTGNPKGVVIPHRGIMNRLFWMNDSFGTEMSKSVLQTTNHVYDSAVWQFFWPLINGGKTVIPVPSLVTSAEYITDIIRRNEITLTDFVPSVFNILVTLFCEIDGINNDFSSLKGVIIGGEEIGADAVGKFMKSFEHVRVFNLYGPTEASIGCVYYEITGKEDRIPIGKPISNVKIYILDAYYKPVPLGIIGEIFISGVCLADGYWMDSERTEAFFMNNPFSETGYERLYRTGDLGRYLQDGNIEFAGRADNQVKIRGFRIEPGEIESHLKKHESVKECVVTIVADSTGSKNLCAYVVTSGIVEVHKFREYLSKQLPEYMIPTYYVGVEEMPLTSGGKIDRKALPKPEFIVNSGVEYCSPRTELELKMADMWKDVLGVQKISIDDNFFDIGGNSLKAVILLSRIHKEFDVKILLSDIFKTPTIREISSLVKSAAKSIYSSLNPVKEREHYPLSSAQKRMLVLNSMERDGTSYNMPGAMNIKGYLNSERLENAFKILIERHDSLRTSFLFEGNEPVQKVHKNTDFEVEKIELSEKLQFINEKEAENRFIKDILDEFIRPFDLSKAPLLRVVLIRISNEEHVLIYDMHHIISDGTSIKVLIREFANLYNGEELPELKIQYKDFCEWQNDMLKSETLKRQEKYWLNRFEGNIPVLNLPEDFKRPAVQSFEGDSVDFTVDEKLTQKLYAAAAETGTTIYMILLASYNILLSFYTGQDDIIVGTPIAGRPHADLENMVGIFVNTLCMRNRPEIVKTFREFLSEVKKNSLDAFENQDYPLDELINKLKISRDVSRNPLFDAMFLMQNIDSLDIKAGELTFAPYDFSNKTAKMDLLLEAYETNGTISLSQGYCTKLFKKESIRRMAENFINILETVIDNPDVPISKIDFIGEEEKNQLLYGFNDTYCQYQSETKINELFEKQVRACPDNTALIWGDTRLTYFELNRKANQLARLLRDKGLEQDCPVGLLVRRTPLILIGILGILKAGGAYLPVDPEYPEERIRYMLRDCNAKILLSTKLTDDTLGFDGDIIDLEDENIFSGDHSDLERCGTSRNLAYIIYTSGSTGKPKGVMIEHRSVINLVNSLGKVISFSRGKTMVSSTSISFDLSINDTLIPVLTGMTLVIADEEQQRSPELLARAMVGCNVNMIATTPSRIKLLQNSPAGISALANLTDIMIGGEAFPHSMLNDLKSVTHGRIYNLYGPTEYTVWTSLKDLTEENEISIGSPISNTRIFILDRYDKVLPIGVYGELCISGDGLARGYINKPELNKEKFVPNPFAAGEWMYRTGDLARWLSDGNIEFLGRRDNQIKIRGYRIELGEIQSKLLEHEQITEAIVVPGDDKNSGRYLCAYIVADMNFTVSELRNYLSVTLPEYMIPSYFIRIEKIPLTANGKINVKELPKPGTDINTGLEFKAPQNEAERKLLLIWSELLGVEKIGIYDDFFDLGGDSVKATILISQVNKEFNTDISLKEVFRTPTISDLGGYLQNEQGAKH